MEQLYAGMIIGFVVGIFLSSVIGLIIYLNYVAKQILKPTKEH